MWSGLYFIVSWSIHIHIGCLCVSKLLCISRLYPKPCSSLPSLSVPLLALRLEFLPPVVVRNGAAVYLMHCLAEATIVTEVLQRVLNPGTSTVPYSSSALPKFLSTSGQRRACIVKALGQGSRFVYLYQDPLSPSFKDIVCQLV